MSAALYAYSLVGIAATGDELRVAVEAQTTERSIPASYRTWDEDDRDDCPEPADTSSRVRL